MRNRVTNQKELRKMFWANYPQLDRKKIKDHRGDGLMYCVNTRCAWVDYVDAMAKGGEISEALAARANL